MELDEILPAKPVFEIKSMGKTYELRPPNMADQVWFKSRYKDSDKFEKAFENEDWEELALVAFYLLSQEDKRDFLAGEVTVINHEGEEKKIHHSGPQKLLVSLSGLKEMFALMQAVTRAIITSNPVAEEHAKKKLLELKDQQKSLLGTQPLPPGRTSQKPSISSARSTDNRSKRSRA